ncbi:MAG TPA: hypothetical protein PKN29_07425 [Candidatus Ozemobacteraceae bacterium]|nr:hypothetical protein [Candidatus Ozemobacteraceae bacterium]
MTPLKTYSYQIDGNPDEMLEKFRNKFQTKGLQLDGDINNGTVSGFGFKATYSLRDQNLTIDVHEKPALIPWAMLDEHLKP